MALTVPPERVGKAGGKIKFGIRPEDIHIVDGDDGDNTVTGEIFLVEPLGRDDMLDVVVSDAHFYVLASPEKRLRVGDRVSMRFDTNKSQFFDPQTERSLLWT